MSTIDFDALKAMKDLGASIGKDLVAELTQLFIAKTPEVIEQMMNANLRKDFKTVSEKAHYLKSSSGSLGAARMFELCKTLEVAAKTPTYGNYDKHISDIHEEYKKVQEELMKFCGIDGQVH